MVGRFDFSYAFFHWFRYLMNAFTYAGDSRFFVVDNGKIGVAYNTPEWKEGLKYIRGMVQEGLIPLENLTQDNNQVQALLNSPEVRGFSFNHGATAPITAGNPAKEGYSWGLPLKGPKGINYSTFRPSTASIAFMISSNCKNPDAAFKVGDTMVQRHLSIVTHWGEEGVNWDYPENVKNIEDYIPTQAGWPISIVPYGHEAFWQSSDIQDAS
jgi:putative aldouronate transport system substrate-binding protein